MKFSNELISEAKKCKSAEEIAALAKVNGMDISEKEAKETFAYLNKKGELADDELDGVAGGACYESGDAPLYSVGEIVSLDGVNNSWEIAGVSSERQRWLGMYDEYTYTLKYLVDGDHGYKKGELRYDIYEHVIMKLG